LKYDPCGVCGGDGSSCYSPCPYKSCSDCTGASWCSWCDATSQCVVNSKQNSTACASKWRTGSCGNDLTIRT
jgi:hypothetical protein